MTAGTRNTIEGILVDSSAWIEFFEGTPRGKRIAELLKRKRPFISAATVTEVCARIARGGKDDEAALRVLLRRAIVSPFDSEIAFAASRFQTAARKLGKPLSFGDAAQLATADHLKLPFLTCDNDFAGMKNVIVIR